MFKKYISPKIKTHKHFLLLYLLLSCALYSCSTPKSATENKNTQTMSETLVNQEQIAFLFFKIQKNPVHNKVTLASYLLKDGKLKSDNTQLQSDKQYLHVVFLNQENNKVSEIFLNHPLYPVFESPDENGAFNKNQLALDSAEFNFRIQNNSEIKSLIFIEKLLSETMVLDTITLPFNQ